MRLDRVVRKDDLRVLSSEAKSVGRIHLHRVLDDAIRYGQEKVVKCSSISDSDFDKDIRTVRGKVLGLIEFKKLLTEIDEHYGR